MTIPASTSRYHLEPYWLGDSPRAVARAAGLPVGRDRGRYIDINMQRTRDGVVACHWETAAKNGYRYIVSGRKRRRMTDTELHKPLSEWRSRDVTRWRRTARYGPSYASRVRPYTFAEIVRYAKRRGVIVCAELKSRSFANLDIAQRMVRVARALDATVYYMALVNMRDWQGKAHAITAAGGEFALLAHNQHKPSDLGENLANVAAVWGRFK